MNIYHDLATAVRRAPGYDPAAALLERAFAHKDAEIAALRGRLHILHQDFDGRGEALTREVNRKLDAQEQVEALSPMVDAAADWFADKITDGQLESAIRAFLALHAPDYLASLDNRLPGEATPNFLRRRDPTTGKYPDGAV